MANFQKSMTVGMLLMNKLYKEKRFDDVIQVFKKQEEVNVGRIMNSEVYLDATWK